MPRATARAGGVPLLRRARRLRGAVEPVNAGLDPARAAHGRAATARRPHVDEERRPPVLRRHAAEPAGHDAAWVKCTAECRAGEGDAATRQPGPTTYDHVGFAASLWCTAVVLAERRAVAECQRRGPSSAMPDESTCPRPCPRRRRRCRPGCRRGARPATSGRRWSASPP